MSNFHRRAVRTATGAVRSSTARWVAVVSSAVLVGTVLVSTPAPAAVPIGTTGEVLTDVAVLGTNSVHLDRNVTVAGSIVANEATPVVEPEEPEPETLTAGFELSIDRNVIVTGNVAGDSVLLDRAGVITGEVAYNELTNDGSVAGSFAGPPLALPIFADLPPFEEASVREDAPDVDVDRNATETLTPGEYGDIVVDRDATLVFAGGTYDVRSITVDRNSAIEFAGATDLKVEGRLAIDRDGRIGPADASIDASDIVIYVGGSNGGDGSPDATPAAAEISLYNDVDANLFVARGTALLERNVTLTGSVIARDVDIDRDVAITVASAYGNTAPVAVSQLVADDTEVRVGAEPVPVPITLDASDADGDELTFTLTSLPTDGTLAEGGAAVVGPAPVALAGNALEYTPAATIDENFADSFTFEADDGELSSNGATVEIRGPEADANPPGVAGIEAKDDSIETVAAIDLVLNAAASAPIGDLTFAVVTAPPGAEGSLGAVTDVVPDPPTTPVRSATVTFTPAGGFAGDTSFVFEACEVAAPANCDTATFAVSVQALAPEEPPAITNVGAELTEGGTVEIDLQLGNGDIGPQPPAGAEEGRLGFAGPSGLRQVMPMNATVDDEAAFLGLLSSSTTYDFEDPPFPSSGSTLIECIPSGAVGPSCPTGDVYFDAYTADRPAAPSPVQGMRGTNLPAPVDGPAEIHFDALTTAPNAFGFFADVGVNAPSATINVTVNYTDESSEVVSVDVSTSSTSSGGQIYFGFVNDGKSIYSIELQGKDADGDDSEFFIDDLTIGTGTEPAQTTLDSTVAWNVADISPFDGLGDASNADGGGFPSAPGLISASNNTIGGPGSDGNSRVHIEYDISSLSGVVDAAEVTVHTSPGTSGLDTLPTFFYAATGDGDGTLSNSDFETVATQVSAVLPNETGIESFTFDVTEELQAAIDAGFDWFVIQGRVVESPPSTNPGGERGMQIRSQCATCSGANPPELSVRFGTAPLPDLVVASLTHDPASPTTEDNIDFTAVVENIGTAAAGPSTLSFKIGGESPSAPAALFAVPALAPGETFEVVRTLSLIAQGYQNTAVADFDEDVAESNEANNTTIDLYTVTDAVETRPVLGTFEIVALPVLGTLYNSLGAPITSVPTTLPDSKVSYVAGPGALAGMVDQFEFTATNAGGTTSAFGYLAIVAELILPDECAAVGRPPGCSP